jgi:sarcosine oxidase subunit beta
VSVQSSDVIVVGGGIMGAATTFFLRRRDVSVTLLERDRVGQKASGSSFGNIRRQGRPISQLPLANRASAIWATLPDLLGEEIEVTFCGHIRVGYDDRPELIDDFIDYAREARETGLELDVFHGKELKDRFPFLGPEVLVGSYSAEDGHSNPRQVAPAFARTAKAIGARIQENTAVRQVSKNGCDFVVETDDGRRFSAPALLIAAGAWSNSLAEGFGERLNIVSHGPTMLVTEPAPYVIRPCLGVVTPVEEESVYLRQIPRGNVIVGGSFRSFASAERCRAIVDPRNTLSQLRQLHRLVPVLGQLNVIRVWSGVEGYTPDGLPVIGPSSTVDGLYYACGFSGGGHQLGPGVGDVLAELIDTGSTTTPIGDFGIGRFQDASNNGR